MACVNPPLHVWGPIHLFLWSHNIGVPARFVYLLGVWAATWVALGRIRSMWMPTVPVKARLWLMAGLVIAVVLGVFAVMDAQHRGRMVCSQWVGSRCVTGHVVAGTAYMAALEAMAAALTMWIAVVGSRTSRPTARVHVRSSS
jgi:hypothetical protein